MGEGQECGEEVLGVSKCGKLTAFKIRMMASTVTSSRAYSKTNTLDILLRKLRPSEPPKAQSTSPLDCAIEYRIVIIMVQLVQETCSEDLFSD